MDELEMISCQIIAAAGGAKSSYIEAVQLAGEGNFEEAHASMKEGSEVYLAGHDAHAKLLAMSANGELENIPLLLMHAEDQMMNCETIKLMAEQLISQSEAIQSLSQKIAA